MKRREILEGTIQFVSSSCFHPDYCLIIYGYVIGEGNYSVWWMESVKRLSGSTHK